MAASKLKQGLKSALKGPKSKAGKKVRAKPPSKEKLKRMDEARKKGQGALMREGLSDIAFPDAIQRVKRMALKPAARNKKLIEVYKKYGRKVPKSLIMPVGKKGGGKMKTKGKAVGGKMKSKALRGGGKMKSKALRGGGKMKTKGYAVGGKMKTKGMSIGGKMNTKGKAAGGKKKGGAPHNRLY